MSRPKKKKEEPVAEPAPIPEVKEETGTKNSPIIDDLPEMKETKEIVTPESINFVASDVKAYIKEVLSKAPKRNDATTMPATVNLRCKTGDMHFIMPQFDAVTVQKLWYKVKDKVTPEEFVSYLYSAMGLNPPKLYMYSYTVNIQ